MADVYKNIHTIIFEYTGPLETTISIQLYKKCNISDDISINFDESDAKMCPISENLFIRIRYIQGLLQ